MRHAACWFHRVGLVALTFFATAASAASISLDGGPIVLGETQSAGITLRVADDQSTVDRPLRLSVNVGRFGEVTRTGPGVYRTTYFPPATLYPQVALIAAWRETGPDAHIDFLRLPLYGRTSIDVAGRPGSTVSVEVGLDAFGPEKIGKRGSVRVPISVAPGIPDAKISVTDRTGKVTERSTSIVVPSYNRMTVALVPHAVFADGRDFARIEVWYEGAHVPPEMLRIEPSVGKVTLVNAETPGRFVYRYVPPVGTSAREVSFKTSVAGDPISQAQVTLKLGLPPPASVKVVPPEKPLIADGASMAPVILRVFDQNGLALARQKPTLTANGVPVAPVHDRGDGTYEAPFQAPPLYPTNGVVSFVATVSHPEAAPVTGEARYQVLPAPIPRTVTAVVSPNPLRADGRSRATIALDVRDDAGLPLKGARLLLTSADGTVGGLVEVGDGHYRADFVPPSELPPTREAVVNVADSSGAFRSAVHVPLRRVQHLMVGVRGGLTHSFAELMTPRIGLDLLAPIAIGEGELAVGLTATYTRAFQSVSDASGELTSSSSATLIPVSARLLYRAWSSPWLSVHAGGGAVAAWAQVKTSLNPNQAMKLGWGALGVASGALHIGPGQLFMDLSYTWAPIAHRDFSLDAGGVGAELGYRVGLF